MIFGLLGPFGAAFRVRVSCLYVYCEPMTRKVHALVLAAGLSTRMGRFKQLLPFGDVTVVESVVRAVFDGGVDALTVILWHRADDVAHVLRSTGVETVYNAKFRDGMFSSILCGLSSVSNDCGVMVVLGDQPQIKSGVVRQVADAFRKGAAGIVVPVANGKRGHPVVIDSERYRDEIMTLSKPVVRGHPEDTLELALTDERILRDLDTPEDYARELDLRTREG